MSQKGATLWFTGLSGAGKTTICQHVHNRLQHRSILAEPLDGDDVRQHLAKDLGYSWRDRMTNIERAAYVAHLLNKQGTIVLASFISPYEEMRDCARRMVPAFHEIYVKCALESCIRRDVKGLYRRAIKGEIESFTGISDTYEPPEHPDLVLDTDRESIEESTDKVIRYLEDRKIIPQTKISY